MYLVSTRCGSGSSQWWHTYLVSAYRVGTRLGSHSLGQSSGVSRISARGVLKVRPDTKSVCVCVWGGGVQSTSGPIRKVGGGGGGGGGGGAVRFGFDTKSGGLCLAHSKYVIVNN